MEGYHAWFNTYDAVFAPLASRNLRWRAIMDRGNLNRIWDVTAAGAARKARLDSGKTQKVHTAL